MFKLAIAALFISSAAAADTLSAGSPKGRALLKHAKVIRPSVHLRRVEEDGDAEGEDGEWADYGDYQYEAEAELDIAQMSIKYLGCSEWQSVDNDWEDNQYEQQVENYYENQEGNADADGGEEAEAEDYQQNNYQNYNDGMVKQSMVRFTLCTSSCGSCSGEYAVDMLEFLDAYTESKMDTLEYQCEMIRERCYCQNGNWEQCFYDCYEQAEFDLYGSDAGVSYCLNQYYGKEAFALQNYLECAGKYRSIVLLWFETRLRVSHFVSISQKWRRQTTTTITTTDTNRKTSRTMLVPTVLITRTSTLVPFTTKTARTLPRTPSSVRKTTAEASPTSSLPSSSPTNVSLAKRRNRTTK